MLWKWPTTHRVLWARASYWIVARPDALEPGDEPRHHRDRQELRRRRPLEVRPVDREAERVERERRRDRDGVGERLHPEVDGLLERVREVDVHVVRADHHVRADADQPADADDVAGDERPLRVPRDQVVVDGRPPGRAAGRRPGARTTTACSSRAPDSTVSPGQIDWTTISTRSTASGHGRDDHVDRDHGQRDDRERERLLGREAPRPDVAEAERAAAAGSRSRGCGRRGRAR